MRHSVLELYFIKDYFRIQTQTKCLDLQIRIPHFSFQFHDTDPLQQTASTHT